MEIDSNEEQEEEVMMLLGVQPLEPDSERRNGTAFWRINHKFSMLIGWSVILSADTNSVDEPPMRGNAAGVYEVKEQKGLPDSEGELRPNHTADVTASGWQSDDINEHVPAAIENETVPLNISQIRLLMDGLYEKFFDTEFYHQQLEKLRYSVYFLEDSEVSKDIKSRFVALEVKLSRWLYARRYIDRTIYILILVIGLIGNVTLLIIFSRHCEVRTVPNMVILSIAISDTLSLVGLLPVYYLTISIGAESFMKLSSCYYYAFYRVTLLSITELSVATLSIQRLLATKVLQKENSIYLLLTTSRRVVGFTILGIWLTSMLVTTPVFFVFEFIDGTCFPYIKQTPLHKTCLVFYLLFFITFPFPIVYLTGLTAWRLSKISKVPARTALIITVLAVFYLTVYIPRAAWYGYASWVRTNRHDALFLYIDMALSYLHFMDSCLNPVALFIASRTFRRFFIKYLFSCKRTIKSQQLQTHISSSTCTTSQI